MSQHLLRQLEDQRFLHAIATTEEEARGLKKLNTGELVRVNQYLTGNDEEPWRIQATSVKIPSGRTHHFNVMNNPVHAAREIIGEAQRLAANQEMLEAVLHIYSRFILQHLFIDANRRTAMIAALWLAKSHGCGLDVTELARFPVGDLREPEAVENLRSKLRELLR